jgi:tellurite resistance protein TerC
VFFHSLTVWLGFGGLVLALLALDLGVLNRRSHVLTFKEAMGWSAGWTTLGMVFGVLLWWREGTRHALEYYTGYLIELSLSVDNLFVFILIFQYFAVPAALQPRVLKWGIIGAVIMRGIMITTGSALLARFQWVEYVFGAIVLLTAYKMLQQEELRLEPERNPVIRLARRILPFSDSYDGQHFTTYGPPHRADGNRRFFRDRLATPLLLVLLVVETTDVVFALDSIPAIFAVTRDPFIVYTSNIFAILGLRALFFVLAGILDRFTYVKPAVGMILVFVGVKMISDRWLHIPISVSLTIVLGTLALGVGASIVHSRKAKA